MQQLEDQGDDAQKGPGMQTKGQIGAWQQKWDEKAGYWAHTSAPDGTGCQEGLPGRKAGPAKFILRGS